MPSPLCSSGKAGLSVLISELCCVTRRHTCLLKLSKCGWRDYVPSPPSYVFFSRLHLISNLWYMCVHQKSRCFFYLKLEGRWQLTHTSWFLPSSAPKVQQFKDFSMEVTIGWCRRWFRAHRPAGSASPVGIEYLYEQLCVWLIFLSSPVSIQQYF